MSDREAIVDLRSDTVTRPTPAMREAMARAEVGDDVFRDDPTVLRLECAVAALLGKEAALFVPSGTMANQIAVGLWAHPGEAIVAHARSHVCNFEGGGPAALWGVTVRTVDSPDGTLPREALLDALCLSDDPHFAPTVAIFAENTHNACGGRVLPRDHLGAIGQLAREHGLRCHLDGARLWNAAVATRAAPHELAAPFDTVSVCFSKGLGAPAGSVLAGPRDAIARALRLRKRLGGAMRQAGVLAAAALYALEHHVDRLAEDHARAHAFAEAIAGIEAVEVDLDSVETNIVYFRIAADHPLARVDHIGQPEAIAALAARGVLVTGRGRGLRAVFHLDVDDADTERAIEAVRAVF